MGERGGTTFRRTAPAPDHRPCAAAAARIVLFDEATSAVDRLSENQINRAVEELGEGTTVIVVSHKPSAVLRAEKTYILCEGRVEDSGRHEELLKRNDFYRALAAEA